MDPLSIDKSDEKSSQSQEMGQIHESVNMTLRRERHNHCVQSTMLLQVLLVVNTCIHYIPWLSSLAQLKSMLRRSLGNHIYSVDAMMVS